MPNLSIGLKERLKSYKEVRKRTGEYRMPVKGTALLREINQKNILDYIRTHEPCSRKEIAQALKVSKNTVSLIVEQLLKQKMIAESGIKEPIGAGRPKVLLRLRPDALQTIGLMVQQDNISYIVLDFQLNELEEGSVSIKSQSVLDEVINLSKNLASRFHKAKGIGIAVPGIVDPTRGYVYQSANLNWKDVDLKKILSTEVKVPVEVFNNVKIAAERGKETVKPKLRSSFFYIRIGEGIGGAYVADNQVMNGNSWTAGEIGHLSVASHGPICKCGQKGCLEKIISMEAFREFLQSLSYTPSDKNDMDLTKLAKQDHRVHQEIEEYGNYLGRALVQVIHLLNPQEIVIEAPYNQIYEFQEKTISSAKQRTLSDAFAQTKIVFSKEFYSPAKGAAVSILLNS
ncbi:ROK family transcriptional regulator [Fictibacillus sp. WQ 8-8]|uniref:ROK family transcriptional regulator n=1 Tax=Fictibacillus sp. WQ 8-8 TaxID=2938788 RepID=UPI00210B18EB|nr:ROK family transcriptional regulator [Fictibacillus sp. WQ 8-8]MCQ6267958.1 ROK family transcriptional regulator [Fictibacillus sp. WQ 8-8]